ncbi:MAG: hypothetical protein LBH18_00750 [Spirochaetaceae bacterium]|jgi:hypothetical protein|nr:hypothetical protein [Spirochaetaceae bacterium]
MEKLYSKPDRNKENEEGNPLQSVFGLWEDYDINKETLRTKAWRQN